MNFDINSYQQILFPIHLHASTSVKVHRLSGGKRWDQSIMSLPDVCKQCMHALQSQPAHAGVWTM